MKNKKIIIFVIIAILFVFIVPILIDWVIIRNNFPSNITNSDWIGFLGDYIGAIIGAIVSFVGIGITIKFTNDQNKKDRELQIRPYCSIRCGHSGKIDEGTKILSHLAIACEPKGNHEELSKTFLYIKNIGLGPAVEFEFEIDDIDDGSKHYQIPIVTNEYDRAKLLLPGEEGIFPIYYWFNLDPVSSDKLVDITLLGKKFKMPVGNNKKIEFNITIMYSDLLQNSYSQKVVLNSVLGVRFESDGKFVHLGDFEIKEIGKPQIL